MKKFIAMVMLVLGVAAMAGSDKNTVVAPAKQYDLTLGANKEISILYNSHEKDSKGNLVFKPGETINYTVTTSEVHASIPTPDGGSTPHRTGKLYFTNNTGHTIQFSLWKEEDWHDTANISGQNQWHEIPFKYENAEHGENGIKDYGIYLYDPESDTIADHVYQSAMADGRPTVYEIKDGESFGVYYGTNQIHQGDYITTTDNWVGDYDNEVQHETSLSSITDDAELIMQQEESTGTIVTSEPFMCLFQGSGASNWDIEYKHFEFIFAKADAAAPSGQPLPGTLATILISGLCAGTLRKRSKKH